ncbi:MAG: Sapep family Mn(2+)-dependent dipeptidase, partial [Clostridia bacterium]|nr:Sapep family Mn(2+)-dependent dipeptidase [Clostridia bacterium]
MQKYFQDIVKSIQSLVKFDSSLAPATENAPFGAPTRECLTAFLSLAKSMGFETHDYDGYAGEVIFGEGEEFAILAHLDVVPAGDGWHYPPFGGVIVGDKLYGRGTMDDKGPAVISLYCLYALKQEGFLPKRKIKLIVGCNEETGWACMEHYKKVATMPEEGISPDADFPVIYAEKGIAHVKLNFPVKNAPFTALSGGKAANMVCDFATASPAPQTFDLTAFENPVAGVSLTADNGVLTARGVSAHGSTPEKGANALQSLLAFYARENDDVAYAYNCLFGHCFGLKTMCDETGYLSYSPNVAAFENGVLSVTVDIRYPATHALTEVTHVLNEAGISYELLHTQAPLMNDENGSLIQTLLSVYNRVTGKNAKPIAIGGGTYARVLKRGC